MKFTFKTKLMLFFLIAFMLLSPICMATSTTAEIDNTNSTDDSVEGTYEFIASDIYEFDDDVIIDSIIDGNAFVFGNNITVSGEIGGDVFAFGGNVTIADNAYIHGSIFVFAKDITMNGICYDIYGAAETFTLGNDAIVARDIRIGANKIYINGQVKRDAYINTNELVFPENASTLISGNLNYTSTSEFVIDKNIVGGAIKFTQEVSEESTMAEKISSYVENALSALLYALVIVLLTIWLAPNFKNKTSTILKKKVLLSLGIGLLASIVIIFGAFVLLIFTAGLAVNISFAAIAIFVLALTISQTVFGMGCAKLIAEKAKKDNLPIFIGMTLFVVLVLNLVKLIPFIGSLIGFVTTMIGLGMILLNLMHREKTDESSAQRGCKTLSKLLI